MQTCHSKIGQKILNHTFKKIQTGGHRFGTHHNPNQATRKHLKEAIELKSAEPTFELVAYEDQQFVEWCEDYGDQVKISKEDHSNTNADTSVIKETEYLVFDDDLAKRMDQFAKMFTQEQEKEMQPTAIEIEKHQASGNEAPGVPSLGDRDKEREAKEYVELKNDVMQRLQSKLDDIKYERVTTVTRILLAQALDPAIKFESRGTLR